MPATLLVSSTMAQSTTSELKNTSNFAQINQKARWRPKIPEKTNNSKTQIIPGIIFGISHESNLGERNPEESPMGISPLL